MSYTPLAEKLRPQMLNEIVGQEHLSGAQGFLTKLIEQNKPLSVIFWGPPGCGKTTLARVYTKAFKAKFLSLSAVTSGVADLKKMIHEIESTPLFSAGAFLFIDEIHRYNKAQQDLLLPYIEKGTFILVGATTENPSFSLNNALLSRVRVLRVNALEESALETLIKRYEANEAPLHISNEARNYLKALSHGDGRYLLNLIENIHDPSRKQELSLAELEQLLQRRAALFDKSGDGHYNLISALHKAVRGSDPDAALYWFCRMIEGGEDPLFLARRLIRMATEDIGLADPEALKQAISGRDAYEMLGSPEGELALAQVVIYLALAPKSNALYLAYKKAKKSAERSSHLNPPNIILNAPTALMKTMGYGQGYHYDHDTAHGFSGQNYFPDELNREDYYHPVERGFEREMIRRKDYFSKLRAQLQSTRQESKV